MSTEFFETMESIEKLAKEVKFLDGNHPAVGDKYENRVKEIKNNLEAVNVDLKKELAKFFKGKKASRRVSKSKTIPKS
jgi:hypothetical protein